MSHRNRRRLLAAGVVSAVVFGAGALALPALAEDNGAISGHFTRDGAPMTASVTLFDANLSFVDSVVTDETGAFLFAGVPAGEYRLGFFVDTLRQFAVQRDELSEADPVIVTAGQTTVVEEEMLPAGGISGTVTNPDGSPAADVRVTVDPIGEGTFSSMPTDSDGSYAFPYLRTGEYRLEFQRDGAPTQYAHGKLSGSTADTFTVTNGGLTVVDEQLLGGGTLSGLVQTADGTPVPFTSVIARRLGEEFVNFGFTDESGQYTIRLFDGDYELQFFTPYGTPVATVTVAGDTSHVQTLDPFGTVEVDVVNSLTGSPVAAFCVNAFAGAGACTETGSVSLDLLPGEHGLSVSSPDGSFLPVETFTTVSANTSTSVTVQVQTAPSVTATMVDAKTKAPVQGACLELIPVTSPTSLGQYAGVYCTDETGSVTIRPVQPGTYVAFAWAYDGAHGHQWVGNHSGTGMFEKAYRFTVAPGQAVTLPQIRLDEPGGDVVGTITDQAGQPVPDSAISLSSVNLGAGPGSDGVYYTDETGHYRISGLGPYSWTFLATGYPLAPEWSGDSPTRAKAKGVKVRKSGVVVHNVTLDLGTTVTGILTGPGGVPASDGRVTFINVDSRDEIGVDDIFDATVPGEYVAHVKGPQRVKVNYYAQIGDEFYSGWIGGDSFETATTIQIPRNGTLTLHINATTPAL